MSNSTALQLEDVATVDQRVFVRDVGLHWGIGILEKGVEGLEGFVGSCFVGDARLEASEDVVGTSSAPEAPGRPIDAVGVGASLAA